MDGKHTGVNFIFLILTLSGGFRLILTEIQPLPIVLQDVGRNVEIECLSESMNSTDQPSWFKYDHGKIDIYNASSSSNSNSRKYTVGNGDKTLAVMNVQLSDAATYCCNVGGSDDLCSNVVVISSQTASVKPSNGVGIGDNVTLTCTLVYNAPTNDTVAPFPFSDDQDPKLFMHIGKQEIYKEQVVNVDTVPYRKSVSINKTVEVADLDRELECEVSSTKRWPYRPTFAQIAPIRIIIIYPNNAPWYQFEYRVGDVFVCIADRFPFLNVTWTDITRRKTSRIISTGIGNATAEVLAPGNYVWTCSISSPLKPNAVSQQQTFTARNLTDPERTTGSAGEKVTRSILLTAGCMLFIAFLIF